MRKGSTEPRTMAGAAAGALGGLVGSWMMVRFNHVVGGRRANQRGHAEHREQASPNAHDGTISNEPGSIKMAALAGEAVAGHPIGEREQESLAPLFHYGFGMVVGALYGALAEREPQATMMAGLPFGATVWVVADESGLPLAGLSAPPTEYPPARHASALATHLVYGVAVEAVRRALRGRRRSR